jgi:hypothetical protein
VQESMYVGHEEKDVEQHVGFGWGRLGWVRKTDNIS